MADDQQQVTLDPSEVEVQDSSSSSSDSSESTPYMVAPNPKGLVEPGNIPIWNRPTVKNADGSHSTEYSTSFQDDKGHEVLVPTIVNGKFLTPNGTKPPEGSPAEKQMFQAAWQHYRKTGEHLGKFDNPDDADAYAEMLHDRGKQQVPTLDADEVEFTQPSTQVLSQQQASDAMGKLFSRSDAPLQPEYQSPAKSTLQRFAAPQRESEAEQELESQGGGGYRIQPANAHPQTIGEEVKNYQTPGKLTPTSPTLSKPSGPPSNLPADPWYEGLSKALSATTEDIRNPKNPFTTAGNPMLAYESESIKQIRDGAKLFNDNWNDSPDDNTQLMMRGITQMVNGIMGATTPILAAEVGANPAAARTILLGIGAGTISGAAAAKATKAMGFSQDAQDLARTLGFFLPSAAGALAGLQTGSIDSENLKGKGFSLFGGRVAGGVGATPEEYAAGLKVGGQQVSVNIPRPTPNPAQVTAAQLTDGAISAMGEKQAIETAATAIVNGAPPAQVADALTPKPPTPPTPTGMDQGILHPATIADLARAISIAPAEQRPALVLEAHQNLAKWMTEQGRVMIDGQIHIVKTPDQAQTLAAKLVNAEVARQDEARNQATEAQKNLQAEKSLQSGKTLQNPNEPAEDPQERLYQRAVTILESSDKPSVSLIQRNLRLGYGAANDLFQRWQQEKAAASIPTVGGEGHEVVEESKPTIDAQIDALKNGNVNVVMLPAGSKYMPEVPQGFKVMDVKKGPGAGRYIYNGENISPATIRRAAENGTHGDLLGHVQTKEEIAGKPTAVVQATDQDGTPIQDSEVDATNPQAIQAQAEVLQERHPDAQISVKPTDQVIQERLNAQQQESAPELSTDEVEEAPQARMEAALDRDREALASGETESTNRPLFAESIKESQRQSGVLPELSNDEVEEAPAPNAVKSGIEPEKENSPEPKWMQELAPGTKIIHRFPNKEDGTEVQIGRLPSGTYSVLMRDTDADEVLPTVYHFGTEEKALAKAHELMGNTPQPEATNGPYVYRDIGYGSAKVLDADGKAVKIGSDIAIRAEVDRLNALWRGSAEKVPATSNEKGGRGESPEQGQGGETRPESVELHPEEVEEAKRIDGQDGKETKLLLPSNKSLKATYRLVEAKDLIPSHDAQTFAKNPRYPEGVQERAYDTSKEAQARVIDQGKNYNPAYTINTNPDAVNGPPIITPDGIVLGGNSRAMSTQRAYALGPQGQEYKDALKDQAEDYGFTAEQVGKMDRPVLVREIEHPGSEDEMRRIGTDLNKSMTGALGVSERAVSAGKNISDDTLNRISEMLDALGDDATLRELMTKRGPEIVKMLTRDGVLTDRERPAFVDTSNGGLSEEGKTFFEKALIGKVVDDPRLMDATPKSILNKLGSSLGSISKVATREDEWNLLPVLRAALAEHGDAAARGISIDDLTNQVGMFSGERNPVVDAMARALGEKPVSVKKAFRSYAQDSEHAIPGQSLLIGPEAKAYDAFNHAFGSNLTEEEYLNGTNQAAGQRIQPAQEAKTHSQGNEDVSEQPARNESGSRAEGLTEREPARPEPASRQSGAVEKPKTLSDFLYQKIVDGQMPKDNIALRRMVGEFDGKMADNLRMKDAQEELESAIARRARDIVAMSGNSQDIFDDLVKLYESQPSLNIRTSTSVANQAYSTPAPLAFIADRLAGVNLDTTVYEPTAGNGMLLIGANPKRVTANELEHGRAERLRQQGYHVIEGDALKADVPANSFDAVVANPPFGSVKDQAGNLTKVSVDGYKIGQVDQLIAARALEAMKDDGKATLILGATKTPGGISSADRVFFNWLYSHYNVTSHFEIDGDLYNRQGAGWPVRVINIDGRSASDKVSPEPGTIQRVNTWGEVYDKFREGLGAHTQRPAENRAGGSIQRKSENEPAAVQRPVEKPVAGPDRSESKPRERSAGSNPGEQSGPVSNRGKQSEPRLGVSDSGVRPDDDVAQSDKLAEGQPKREPAAKRTEQSGRPAGDNPLEPAETEFQVKYTPASSKKDEGVLIPTNMRAPLEQAMRALEDEVGDIDEFVQNELGYESIDEMHDALMGLQVDSVASAIHQIQKGKAIIVGDQTGIGKGRQAAAIIRWAERQGKVPVFMSVKPSLFSDMYGDLQDIGSYDIVPQILNADEVIKLPDGKEAFGNVLSRHGRTLESIAATGELPAGKNALFGTYSQINVENKQRNAIRALAPNAVFVLDESHNAGGDSATGDFIREVIKDASGVVYLSATYAKRPDNMPLYYKTDIGEAIGDNNALIDAMKAGGLPLQTVVSNNLVKAGQFFRRERSYAGVEIANDVDTSRSKEHQELADRATEALRAIVAADHRFHADFVKIVPELVDPGELGISGGNKISQAVTHTEFSSVVHNFVRQMLLGLKADAAADKGIDALKRGEKPLIAVDNTMGSFLKEYVETNKLNVGDILEDFSYRTVLQRALDRTRYFMKTLKNGDKVRVEVPLSKLTPEMRSMYNAAQGIIDRIDIDIPVSPIDWIRMRLEKAGHSVAEITGRDLIVDYSDPNQPKLGQLSRQEQHDKVETTRRFNDGRLDAIVLNVAGSTGISLHASERFKDQRQRHMIVAQAAQDINIFMQMLGRIHRTGQVKLPRYTILNVDLPAEKRPTALLSKKMKSLNANTSSNTESATSVKAADILNKYGDQIVDQYLADNPKLAIQLRVSTSQGDHEAQPDLARDATGRLALMPVKTQEEFYSEVEDAYNAYIHYLNETGQNELEPRTLDYDAKELRSQVMVEGANKNSPFGQDAIYGEYSIKSQGKPLTPEEVTAAIQEHAPDGGLKHAQELIADLDKKMDAYLRTFEFGAQREAAVRGQEVTKSFIRQNPIGSTLRVSINDDEYNAAIVNVKSTYKKTGSPYALSKINVQLAVAGPMRFLSVPATQLSRITTTRLNHSPERLFEQVNQDARDTVKIVTGNLLAAFAEMNDTRGTIINFTKADGSTEQGILLPKKFDIKANVNQDYRLQTPEHAVEFLKKSKDESISTVGIASRDGDVRVVRKPSGLQIVTPKAKARGGRYFLDKVITGITGDFYSVGGTMRADIPQGKEVPALTAVMNKVALYASPSMADEARKYYASTPEVVEEGKPKSEQRGSIKTGATFRSSVFGADIAAEAIGKAFAHEFNKEVKPLIQKASTSSGIALRELKSYLVPRSVTDPAALDVVMSALGRREKRAFILERALNGYKKAVDNLSRDEKVAIGDRISLGESQPTQHLEELANFMRATSDDTYKAVVYEQARGMRPALANEWARLSPAAKDEFFRLHMDGKFGEVDDEGKTEFIERATADPDFNDMLSYLPDGSRGENALYRLKEISDAALTYKHDYFGRIWKVKPGNDTVTVPTPEPERRPSTGARGPLAGRKRFLKQQTLPTMAEGIARGGVPYSYNPIQMFKQVQAEHYRFITAMQIWNDALHQGARVFVKRGEKAPEGFSFVEDRIGDVKFPAASGEGMIEAGKWALRDDYARILNNFLSKDWIRANSIGRGMMWTKNQLTAWRLGFSPFHAFTTAVSAIGSQAGLGLQQLNRSIRKGNLPLAGQGLKTFATSPAAPYLNYKAGAQAFKYVENPSEFIKASQAADFMKQYPGLDKMIDAAFAGGAKLALHQDERLNSIQALREAIADKKAIAALWHTVPALNQLAMAPLFEYYIPRVKFGAFIREFSEALADHSADIARGDITHAELARKTWDSVEDVFGQMNWDKFFWNNTLKAAVQLAFRSFTWFAGNIRLAGHAITGQMREIYDSLAYLNKQFRPRSEWEPKYTSAGPIPRLHPDMAKLLGMAITFAAANAMITKIMTGDNPEDFKDFIAARIGGYDEHGRPRRIILPAILFRDMLSIWAHGAGNYLRSKESDLISGLLDVLSNEDFRGAMVHNPDSNFWKQRIDDAEHILGAPIGVSNILNGGKEGEPLSERLLTGAGFANAPRQMDMTPAERKMVAIIQQESAPRTQEEIDEQRAAHHALLMAHTSEGARARREAHKPDVERMFEKLTYIQARDVYENYANPQERRLLKPLLDRKRANLLRRNPGAVRQADANE